ncbi:AfsR/SARP family transcriptional regulator [Micromonospora lupini]|uniref:AfsR/SARP family transcriptional regulator n=1 Tax=Micromonospora lupini TaxID=285679 RepID=UPI0022588143|nr:AfsR/SARP family transcriptional regulator [Micromonospora lupini]
MAQPAVPITRATGADWVQFGVLGPLRITGATGDLPLNARKIRTLLAVLLVRADQSVTVDQLTDEIWGARAPRRATASLHVYVSQLRKLLPGGEHGGLIQTSSSGYQIHVEYGDVDLHAFRDGVERGRALARDGHHELAFDLFREMLDLCRGPVLADLQESPMIRAFTTWLDELRLECTELMIDCGLAIGRHRDLISLLQSLTVQYPLREDFYRQLMLALCGAHRRSEALEVYRTARRTLHDELGLEPCAALRDLHQAALRGDEPPPLAHRHPLRETA